MIFHDKGMAHLTQQLPLYWFISVSIRVIQAEDLLAIQVAFYGTTENKDPAVRCDRFCALTGFLP